MAISDTADTGTYWFPYGRLQIGTYKPVEAGSLTIHYEAIPTQPLINGTDSVSEGALDMPQDWVQPMIDFVAWRVFERVIKGDRSVAAYHRDQFGMFVRGAQKIRERHDGHRAFVRRQDF